MTTAYEWLRRESMRSRQTLEAYCEAFVTARAGPLDEPVQFRPAEPSAGKR